MGLVTNDGESTVGSADAALGDKSRFSFSKNVGESSPFPKNSSRPSSPKMAAASDSSIILKSVFSLVYLSSAMRKEEARRFQTKTASFSILLVLLFQRNSAFVGTNRESGEKMSREAPVERKPRSRT